MAKKTKARALTSDELLERAVEANDREIPTRVSQHIGENRRFAKRKVKRGILKGHTIPGFIGRVVGCKFYRQWILLVDTPEGLRRAPLTALEKERNKRKRRRSKSR